MALPSPSEADDAMARVRVVAEMLKQKAQEVQSKGNAGAAKSLSDSAGDLQRAAALLHELTRHIHHSATTTIAVTGPLAIGPPRSQDGASSSSTIPSSQQPPVSSSVKDLVAKLSRVDAMLGKKSDEMKSKGNDGAAHALFQSALAVRLGAQHIAEQQQMTRTLVATARALREQLREQYRLLLAGDEEISEETPLDDELRQRAMARAQELLVARGAQRNLAAEPVVDHTSQMELLEEQCARLQQQLQETQTRHDVELRAAQEESASMTSQCAALEKALRELEAEYHERREREIEHLNALHERQKDTHEELTRLLLAKEEEVSALKVQAETWHNQLANQRDALTELHAQREQDHQVHERHVGELRDQLQAKHEELLVATEELRELLQQQQQETVINETEVEDVQAAKLRAQIEELREQLEEAKHSYESLTLEREQAQRVQLQEAHERVARMETESQVATRLENEYQTRIASLEAALLDAAATVATGDSEETNTMVTQLNQTIEELQSELKSEQGKRASLEMSTREALAAAQGMRDEQLREQHEEAVERLEELRGVLENECEQRVAALESSLREKEQSVGELLARADQAEAALAAERQSLTQLQQQLVQMAEMLETNTATSTLLDNSSGGSGGLQTCLVEGDRAVVRVWRAVCEQLELVTSHATAKVETRWKREMAALLRTLRGGEDCDASETASGTQDDDSTLGLLVETLRAHVAGLTSELKTLHDTHTAMIAHHATELDTARDAMLKHESQLQQVTEEKTSLHEQLLALKSDHAAAVVAVATASDASECDALRAALVEKESEFDRYRARSHTALKKVEKRAELLNSMRRENETLARGMAEIQATSDAAVAMETELLTKLDAVARLLSQREHEETQRSQEMTAKLQEMEQRCAALERKKTELQQAVDKAESTIAELQTQREALAHAKDELHEQTLAAKHKALQDATSLVETTQRELTQTLHVLEQVKTNAAESAEKMTRMEQELLAAQVRTDTAAEAQCEEQLRLQLQQLQEERDTLAVRITELEALLETKDTAFRTLAATRDAAEAEIKELHAKELLEAAALAELQQQQQQAQLETEEAVEREVQRQHEAQAAAVATATDTQVVSRMSELELTNAALQQETLRRHIASLESQLATTTAAVKSTASTESTALLALRESLDAKEAQLLRLLSEREALSKQQIEDQRQIKELLALQQQQRRGQHETGETHDTATSQGNHEEATLESLRVCPQRVAQFTETTQRASEQLQRELDEYSALFRDACALRDDHQTESVHLQETTVDQPPPPPPPTTELSPYEELPEYEEYLTLTSGVVIKAGATFSLPVFCETRGWRVRWQFAVKEESADVGFALSVESSVPTSSSSSSKSELVVAPARVHELSGVCDAPSGAAGDDQPRTAVLRFEWDNTFSWLNEKTLDYHVTVLQPLSMEKRALRARERELTATKQKVQTRLELLREERLRRAQLQQRLSDAEVCTQDQRALTSEWDSRQHGIKTAKTQLQLRMEELKRRLSALVTEEDEMETQQRAVASAWATLHSELDDGEMTMRLSANSHLDEIRTALQQELTRVDEELRDVERQLRGGDIGTLTTA